MSVGVGRTQGRKLEQKSGSAPLFPLSPPIPFLLSPSFPSFPSFPFFPSHPLFPPIPSLTSPPLKSRRELWAPPVGSGFTGMVWGEVPTDVEFWRDLRMRNHVRWHQIVTINSQFYTTKLHCEYADEHTVRLTSVVSHYTGSGESGESEAHKM